MTNTVDVKQTTSESISKLLCKLITFISNIFYVITQIFAALYIVSVFNMNPDAKIYSLTLVLNVFLIVLLLKFIIIKHLIIIKIFSIVIIIINFLLFQDNDDDVNCYDKIFEMLETVNLVIPKVVFTLTLTIITFIMCYVVYLYYIKKISKLKKHVSNYFVITNFIITAAAFIAYMFVVFIKKVDLMEITKNDGPR